MKLPDPDNVQRREFLKTAGLAAALEAVGSGIARAQARGVSIVMDPADAVMASAAPTNGRCWSWRRRSWNGASLCAGVSISTRRRAEICASLPEAPTRLLPPDVESNRIQCPSRRRGPRPSMAAKISGRPILDGLWFR